MKKTHSQKMRLIMGIILLGLVVASCGSPAQTEEAPPPETVEEALPETETVEEALPEPELLEEAEELPVFTLESLAEYDGKEGKPAYVAVDGIVYDFTELGRWRGGIHNGFEAGQDLTQGIHDVSPHGVRVLNRAPIVGTLEK